MRAHGWYTARPWCMCTDVSHFFFFFRSTVHQEPLRPNQNPSTLPYLGCIIPDSICPTDPRPPIILSLQRFLGLPRSVFPIGFQSTVSFPCFLFAPHVHSIYFSGSPSSSNVLHLIACAFILHGPLATPVLYIVIFTLSALTIVIGLARSIVINK